MAYNGSGIIAMTGKVSSGEGEADGAGRRQRIRSDRIALQRSPVAHSACRPSFHCRVVQNCVAIASDLRFGIQQQTLADDFHKVPRHTHARPRHGPPRRFSRNAVTSIPAAQPSCCRLCLCCLTAGVPHSRQAVHRTDGTHLRRAGTAPPPHSADRPASRTVVGCTVDEDTLAASAGSERVLIR